jgi:hypothetical protein
VARGQLGANHAPTLLAAGRLCLIGGTSVDRAAVAERLTRALPSEVACPLLAELVARDPMLSPPEYLAGLLDHPTPAMRTAAFAELEERAGQVSLGVLAPLCAAARSATRAAALELIGRSDDPLAWNLLASRLGDPSALLARRAADLLAASDGAEPMLLERAFPAELRPGPLAWDRARAYALLALIQREEGTQRALLEEEHVDALRSGLQSSLPLVSGASAIGLARVGFRSGPSRAGSWLDREVPHLLVRCGTGAEYHNDFSSLERPALRALTLLTGESFGADGEAWRRWWLEHAEGFRARHAVIELDPDAARQLLVTFPFERDGGRGETWCLLGPDRAAPAGPAPALRLDAAAAERLCARLESEGVFGAGRMPDARKGERGALSVAVAGQEKCFARVSAPDGTGAWLEALVQELAALAEENRWQLHFDPRETDAGEWWRSQHERWAVLAPVERRRALVELVLETARRAHGAERDPLVAELERLYQDAAVPTAADFEAMLALLAGEAQFGPRAARLCELARVAAGLAMRAEQGAANPRDRLLALVLEREGPEADAALVRLARDLSPDTLVQLARDPRARARALAAHGLARGDAGEARLELLRLFLTDPEPTVQLAVLTALDGCREERAQGLRPLLVERARAAGPEQRLAALRVLRNWGGKDVHDLALEALGDVDERVQVAGVEALAVLADARSASLLAALLARGPESPLYAGARRGLARMGPAGIEECRRLVRSASPRARREAALLLAEALAPEAGALLLALLQEDPADERVAWELSVLAGLDFTRAERPDEAALAWWNLVVHDDPLAWLLAAAARAGLEAPPRAVLEGQLGAEGARFLLALAEGSAPELAERGARELERHLAVEFGRPASAAERAGFQRELREAVRARFGE